MKKIYLIPIIIIFIFLILVFIGILTKDKIPPMNQEDNQQNFLSENPTKGVSLSPISFSGNDFTNFFTKAKEAGGIITWAGEGKYFQDKSSAPYVVQKLSKQYNYEPIMITSLNLNDKDLIVNFVKEYKPKYIGIGNEVNSKENIANFDKSLENFNQAYEEIKKVSPNTQVFVIFQLEEMKKENQWNLISDFDKADFIAFTTYPIIIYQSPSEIPDNYYSEILQHTNKQIAFTEIGWPRKDSQQTEFIQKFNEQTKKMNLEFRIWPFLYDQDIQKPFDTMGLLEKGQETSESFETWKRI